MTSPKMNKNGLESADDLATGYIDPNPPFILPSQTTRKIAMGLTIRQATMDDLPALAIAASDSWRFSPWHLCYHPGVPREEHVRIQRGEMGWWLMNPKAKTFVAHNGEGKLVGYITYTREDPDAVIAPTIPAPAVELHPKSDKNCISKFRALREEWKEDVMKSMGPHYRGELLGTDPRDRQNGIATKLCQVLAEEALKEDLHVFIETTYCEPNIVLHRMMPAQADRLPGPPTDTPTDAVPFYERFAKLGHFKIKFHGDPIRLESMTKQQLSIYLLEFMKKPPEEEGEEAEFRMRVPF